jgi:broad specificity phosphatase PhoE
MSRIQTRWPLIGLLVLVLAASSLRAVPAFEGHSKGPRMVMIIRHAEKPDEIDGKQDPNLSPRGVERANALAKVIPERFRKPDFLIAAGKSKNSDRSVETITPLAKALHKKVESKFKDEEFGRVAQSVLTDPKYAGKTVLISWHHGNIPELAKELGVKDAPPKWKSKVYDRVWEITYENGTATWRDLPQQALTGDSEK